MLVDTFSCYQTFMPVELYACPAVALKPSNSEQKNGEPQVMRIFFWQNLLACFRCYFYVLLCVDFMPDLVNHCVVTMINATAMMLTETKLHCISVPRNVFRDIKALVAIKLVS